ncbi:polysaccharide deacetylase family protein [Alkalimarinus coralli]|uniref:polysaccharide deacetylase family protein n=1 Tax=Alkalimarinus coralli TaxID=2935863 RepID=UPI00202AEE6F|nr:polysaccharide deacetylase family protein [Alkalimarinus coralli]
MKPHNLVLSILLFQAALSNAAVVLQYHHVDTETPDSTSTSPTLFKDHIEFIVNNDFKVTPLTEITHKLTNNEKVEDKTVAITFDDGYISVYENAFPILKKYGIPFTVFVNTDPIEANRPTHISWSQLREMKNNGGTIANHTHNHSYLIEPRSNAKVRENHIINEINTAQSIINKKLKQDIKLFAYPYGEFDKTTKKILSELGYISFGQHSGAIPSEPDFQALPRFPASNQYGQFPQFAQKLNSTAFENTTFKPNSGIVYQDRNNPPELFIYGDSSAIKNINCFGSSVGRLEKVRESASTYMVKAPTPFNMRRFRYNCTSRSTETGRFSWISIPWINLSVSNQ